MVPGERRLSRVAQAFDRRPARVFGSACLDRLVLRSAILCMVVPLAGCGAGGFSLDQADVDKSLVTSSTGSRPVDSDIAADQAMIRNAVSSADVESLAGRALPWANADTGSRGEITALAQSREGGRLCRRFTASRESFDGVAVYKGQACQVSAGAWLMQDFRPLKSS
jgi:hypothetical protein